MEQTTLIILKPDAVQRGLMGRIIARFEDKGLTVVAAKLMQITADLAAKHYSAHKERPFYPGLVGFMTSGPVLVLAIKGKEAIAVCRKLMGKTTGYEAEPGTVRGDFSSSKSYNLVHGSDSEESAKTEVDLFFKKEEILDFTRDTYRWIVDNSAGKAE